MPTPAEICRRWPRCESWIGLEPRVLAERAGEKAKARLGRAAKKEARADCRATISRLLAETVQVPTAAQC